MISLLSSIFINYFQSITSPNN